MRIFLLKVFVFYEQYFDDTKATDFILLKLPCIEGRKGKWEKYLMEQQELCFCFSTSLTQKKLKDNILPFQE